ncbi:zinc metallochaperone AztD [Marinivivus vitaminiproducens]|nr:zinc metallochaperone AztD [Geminicoccaceae bacterium SCSIO 64248]
MKRKFAAATAVALVLSFSTGSVFADEVTAWRLFVTDREQPKVTVIDAMNGETLDTFAIKGPASLYRSESGRSVFAVQGDAGVVTAFSSGISFEDHGDHGDIDVEAPALAGIEIAGQKPSHFAEHDGEFAAFFDGEGVARIISERAVLDGEAEFTEIRTDAPQHGVAVAYGKHVLLSEPNTDNPDELPIGIRTVNEAGEQVGDIAECPDLHGEAFSGNILAFACASGLLIVTGSDAPEIRHLAYPDDLPDGKSTTLAGGRGMQYFLGNYGTDKVVLIDPTAEEDAFRLIELPTRRVHFAVDPVRTKFAYVVTEDGQLHQLDVVAGTIAKSLKLTDPYSMDGHWNDPRPRIAVAGDKVVVTDPSSSKLHLVDAASFTRAGEIPVEGKPYNIVSVGGSGEVHDHDGEESHGHGHDHAHSHHDDQIYKGYFEDGQVKERTLADWAGDWQSVYPYLQNGSLDPVMAHKAEQGDKTADEYRAYYEIGYRTDVERIVIDGDTVTFFEDGKALEAHYASNGYEILTYEAGNRGVRFIFEKIGGDEAAPQYIQFSDHKIAPESSDHYHLYWGNNRAALLEEVTNWPTYYPSSLSTEEIVSEMMAH